MIEMSVYDFLTKLHKFFPLQDKDDVLKEKLNEYADCILEYASKQKKQYNYDKIFKQLLISYKYKTFPSLPDILELMSYGVIIPEVQASYTGREGEVIKRGINGYEYEFTIVPNTWDGIMTIGELDKNIEERKHANTSGDSFEAITKSA